MAIIEEQKSSPRTLTKEFFKEFGNNDDFEPIMTFASERRDSIRNKTLAELKKSFPIEQGDHVLELKNAWIDENDATPTKEREALLKGGSLHENVKGHVVLRKKDGTIIDEIQNHTLAKLPYFTDDHSFILDGTHYVPKNQLRTRSGIFTRKRANEDIEASFNLAKGANFRIALEPEKGRFNMELGTSKIPLYPILRALGKDHDSISNAWGTDLTKMNSSYDNDRQKHVQSLYEKVIPAFARDPNASHEKQVHEIKKYFDSTQMEGAVNKRTLGTSIDKVTPQAMTDASKKLLGVFKGEEPEDDRDSLVFQRIHGIEDFLSERIRLDKKTLETKVKTKIRFPKKDLTIRNLIPPNTFGKGLQSFITSSSVVSVPTSVNPMERLDSATTITRLGEGAIASERAIPEETQQLHGSHFGFIGPLRTPESSHVGIDVRSTIFAAKDKNGIMHTPVLDLHTGQMVYKSVDELSTTPLAFPEQDTKKGNVDVLLGGVAKKVKPNEVRYQLPTPHSMFSITENLIPMLKSVQGNRGTMASKMITQALPLVHAEAPLVQSSAANSEHFSSMEHQAATMIESVSPVEGTVQKIDNDFIYVAPTKGGDILKIPYKQNIPYAKTRFHQEVIVKQGDKIKPLQHLTKSNYTRDGKLAIGKNMVTAYIADNGYNTDDAISISETASNKLTSEHMNTYRLQIDQSIKTGAAAHAVHAPNVFTKAQYGVLDSDGVVKKGTTLKTGDPIILAVKQTTPSAEDIQLGRLHKSLVKSHIDISEVWDSPVTGEVIDAIKTPSLITVTVLSKQPAKRGDKLAGLYGNKGIIGRIIPDSEMFRGSDGKPIDVLFTSAGVISRINPAQITASALGKAAAARGGEYVVKNFDQTEKNNVTFAREELKKQGLHPQGKETLTDPVTGREVPNIFVGNNYLVKLFKTTESNFAARNVGGYDSVQQPTKGGDTAAKSVGNLEVNALLAHNARGLLSDVTNIKSQQNGEFWRAVQLGYPAPPPNKNFAFNKFTGMLQGAGIKINERPDEISMAPMTDADVMRMSSGAIENEKRLRSKDLQPEKGGLFDPVVTGGTAGTKWSHVDLQEPMLNPVFLEPARRLLGKTQREMHDMIANTDGKSLQGSLNAIDVKQKLDELHKKIKTAKGAQRDDILKQIKYLQGLNKEGLKPGEAYMLSKFPVLPPNMRPILPSGSGGSMIVDDANFLYRDLILSNNKKEELKAVPGMPSEFIAAERKQVFQAMSAIAGLGDPISPQSKSRGAVGFIKNIAGTSPKYGFFQSKLVKRKQDLSGSATIALNPMLGVDEIELPEESGWRMYQPFIVKRLVNKGMTRLDAMNAVEDRTHVAMAALQEEIKERPVILNRAPSLHRFSMLGVKPKLIPGKTLNVNPYITAPLGADFDGDAVMLSVPATELGKKDANNMLLSKQLFSDKKRGDLLIGPQHESLIGWTRATENIDTQSAVKKFKNLQEAIAAYKKGEIKGNTLVEFTS